MNEITNDDLINFDDYPAMSSQEGDNDDIFLSEFTENDKAEGVNDPFDDIEDSQTLKNESELIKNLLLQKGINDSSKIQIEDEAGEVTEVEFSSLPIEEQLEILQYQDSPDLEDYEIEVINYLRENNVSLEELIEYQKNLAIQEYLQSQSTSFTVDSLSDEELYKLDIKSRYKEFTDEDVNLELEKELNNPDLFKKKVDKLRELYKEEEIQEQTRLNEQTESEKEESYNTLVNTMVEVAQDTNELFDLELEDSDKEEVLQFLLTQDVNGQSEFVKILNDPQQLFNLAWFALKGKEAFDTVHEYYKKEIDSARKKGSSGMTSRTTVVKKDTKQGDADPYGLKQIFK